MDESELQTLLREGIAAAKAAQQEPESPEKPPQKRIYRLGAAQVSQRERARQLLLQVIEIDETNILAWLWLSTVLDDLEEKKVCLENVLTLDPTHKAALAGLARLDQLARLPQPEPKPAQAPLKSPSQAKAAIPQPQSTSPLSKSPVNQAKSAPQKSSGIACPFCRQTISAMMTTCSRCQLPLVMNCSVCGAAVDIEQKTCSQCNHSMGDYRQGVTYFAKLAAAYQEHEHYPDALKAWQAIETLNPDYPQLHLHLGEAQLGLGRPDRATISFQRALKEDPDSPEVHFAMGELLRHRGEIQEAYLHYLKITQLDPRHGMAWLRLGQLYEKARRRQEAIQAYKRADELLPSSSAENRLARQQLEQLQPSLPVRMATGWPEFIRQMTGPILICIIAALLDSGLRPWWIHWTGWLALLMAAVGTFLWISGDSLPRNPLIRLVLGEAGLSSTKLRLPISLLGLFCWFFAFGLIVLPIGQSFPKPPES